MQRINIPATELQPVLLDREEIENPYLVIEDLFKSLNLSQLREEMGSMFNYLVTGGFPKHTDYRERTDAVFLFRQLEKLAEAVYVINAQREVSKEMEN